MPGGMRSNPSLSAIHTDNMYLVYVLYSPAHDKLYIGSSADPDERLTSHNAGRGGWTKRYRPWVRVLLEEYPDRLTAAKTRRSSSKLRR
jgi:putative endonuclease